MIALTREDGVLVKSIHEGAYAYHSQFGLLSEEAIASRTRARRLKGLKTASTDKFLFRFNVAKNSSGALTLSATDGCTVGKTDKGAALLETALGRFHATEEALLDTLAIAEKKEDNAWRFVLVFALLLLLALPFLSRKGEEVVVAPTVIEPVTVKVAVEVQKTVTVPNTIERIPELQKQSKEVKRAVAQNLGFLGILGRKDLKHVLGGAPTSIKDASPGAGPGGLGGSGGELLVGLGQGVKRTSVGNTGVRGLGGIGTKGAGGGAGGYGNSSVGSGEGKALSSLALTDDIILEGGLDRAVIQATIAKYLSQVRACYEEGLSRNAGMTGQVAMNFEIRPDGSLNYARVQKSSLGDGDVEKCISHKMMGWQFPKPVGGVSQKVTYPFMLRPVHS